MPKTLAISDVARLIKATVHSPLVILREVAESTSQLEHLHTAIDSATDAQNDGTGSAL